MKQLTKQKFIQKSIDFIRQDKWLRNIEWCPMPHDACQKFERKLGRKLPRAFKEYLLTLGNIDELMVFGRDAEMALLSDVLKPEPWEAEEVAEYEAFIEKLKNFSAFCFSSHEGYAYDWFYLSPENENPECYITTDLEVIKSNGPFSEYLLNSLIELSECYHFNQNQ